MFNSALCMNMLAIEQHLATVWVNTYEQKSMKIGVILMVIAILQSVPFGIFVNWYYINKDFDLNSANATCIPIDTHWELALLGFTMCFLTCGLCSLWLVLLHRYNHKRTLNRLKLESLSARYQQTENENTNRSITPSLVGYMMLGLTGLVLSAWRGKYAIDYGVNNEYDKIITDLGYTSVDMYAIYHMFCFMYYNDAMRLAIRRDIHRIVGDFPGSLKIHNAHQIEFNKDADIHTNVYFEQLQDSWK
ncbi:unnamed protein product [Bursaphelenchus okinawaensis]|uniref:G_PROTEIN_RECEP_F1_2 domain-containing protein n=1 Tax=Bursaphelenchus okinawaensis TaxID=465554 RepID=A0A811K0S1_9BILA|nr:unnamed protein product [Bursaphelenchus okinawaensis]CAG9088421.1 unnamed protein product [Bursaphelenchus okinawaensis]